MRRTRRRSGLFVPDRNQSRNKCEQTGNTDQASNLSPKGLSRRGEGSREESHDHHHLLVFAEPAEQNRLRNGQRRLRNHDGSCAEEEEPS